MPPFRSPCSSIPHAAAVALDEIINAAGSLTVQFEVGIRFEDDEALEPAVAQALDAALAKVSPDFKG